MARFPIPNFTNSAVRRALEEALRGDRSSRLILQSTARRELSSNVDAEMAHREARVAIVLLDVKASLDRVENETDAKVIAHTLKGGEQAQKCIESLAYSPDKAVRSAVDEVRRFFHHLREWEAVVDREKRTRPKFF